MARFASTPYLDRASQGPIWPLLSTSDKPSEAELADDAAAVCAWLGEARARPDEISAPLAARVFDLYLPVFYWCRGVVAGGAAGTPAVVFVSAPQGCGKTTLCDALVELFRTKGQAGAALSYDDFYLTHAEQQSVAAGGDRLLEFRGSAGTHDVALGVETLRALKATGQADAPRYDKKAFGGRGDRAGLYPAAARDFLLVEGWMAGFKPVGAAAAAAADPDLPPVDAALEAYGAWDALADAWLVLGVADADVVFRWRLEAERRAGGGLDDAAVADFVGRFLPSYRAYGPALYASAAARGVDGRPTLRVDVDAARAPASAARGGPAA